MGSAVGGDLARAGVQRHSIDLHASAVYLVLGAPQDGSNARRQFARIERLRKIIVGSQLQADDAIDVFAARGQHQNRNAAGGAHALQNLESIQARQHNVQHDQVKAALLRCFERGMTFTDTFHGEALALQKFLEQ
jgi:hypothetical protein